MKINNVAIHDNSYLSVLETIPVAPASLWTLGTVPNERRPTIAIVGTRKPTGYGREVTEKFAYELAARGIVIVSGLAIGVDSIAHRSALDARGTTLAVVANQLPDIYPATNRQLADMIVKSGGAILAEHGPHEKYVVGKWSFLERNRLVAGLSDAILITEASASSGTLNTASHALEQGKDVFVVPGNITSPSSAGCNALLKQGAILVTDIDDILNVIMPGKQLTQNQRLPLGDTPLEVAIIELLQSGVRDGDDIQAALGVDASEINVALTMLEIHGTIRSLGANQWMIT